MCFLGRIRLAPGGRIGWHCCPVVNKSTFDIQGHGDAPNQDPFLPQLPLCVVLRTYFEEEIHEFLQRFRLAGHYETNNVHEKATLGVAIEHYGEDLLLRGCQTAVFSEAGQPQWAGRTMVSIFCSSLPFSRACFSSFCDGTSAALSWWTCRPQLAHCSSLAPPGVLYQTVRILEKRRHNECSIAASSHARSGVVVVAANALPPMALSPQVLRPPARVGCYVYGSELRRGGAAGGGEAAAAAKQTEEWGCPARRGASFARSSAFPLDVVAV
jgi:hypothetical protein